jgi:hypothetical protein
VGPVVRQGAIVHEELDSAADLPAGWTDVQEGGTYRLERREDEALFGHNVGPESWKRLLFPPTLALWRARRTEDGRLEVQEETPERPLYALIGVRSCDLHAVAVQDRGRRAPRQAELRETTERNPPRLPTLGPPPSATLCTWHAIPSECSSQAAVSPPSRAFSP